VYAFGPDARFEGQLVGALTAFEHQGRSMTHAVRTVSHYRESVTDAREGLKFT
jgi:hypothetical protein